MWHEIPSFSTHLIPFSQPIWDRKAVFLSFVPQPAENNSSQSLSRVSSCVLHFTYNMEICGLSYSKQTQEAIRTSEKKKSHITARVFLSSSCRSSIAHSLDIKWYCRTVTFNFHGMESGEVHIAASLLRYSWLACSNTCLPNSAHQEICNGHLLLILLFGYRLQGVDFRYSGAFLPWCGLWRTFEFPSVSLYQ